MAINIYVLGCYLSKEIVGESKEIRRKTDIKWGMATSHVIIVQFFSDRALKLQNQGFHISTLKGYRETTHIFSANIIKMRFCSTSRNTKSFSCVCLRCMLFERRKRVFSISFNKPVKQSLSVSTEQLLIVNTFLNFCNAFFLKAWISQRGRNNEDVWSQEHRETVGCMHWGRARLCSDGADDTR